VILDLQEQLVILEQREIRVIQVLLEIPVAQDILVLQGLLVPKVCKVNLEQLL
jgi:hypothetical protein